MSTGEQQQLKGGHPPAGILLYYLSCQKEKKKY